MLWWHRLVIQVATVRTPPYCILTPARPRFKLEVLLAARSCIIMHHASLFLISQTNPALIIIFSFLFLISLEQTRLFSEPMVLRHTRFFTRGTCSYPPVRPHHNQLNPRNPHPHPFHPATNPDSRINHQSLTNITANQRQFFSFSFFHSCKI